MELKKICSHFLFKFQCLPGRLLGRFNIGITVATMPCSTLVAIVVQFVTFLFSFISFSIWFELFWSVSAAELMLFLFLFFLTFLLLLLFFLYFLLLFKINIYLFIKKIHFLF